MDQFQGGESFWSKNKKFFIFTGVIIALLLVIFLIFIAIKIVRTNFLTKDPLLVPSENKVATSSTATSSAPLPSSTNITSSLQEKKDWLDINTTFGSFYKPVQNNFTLNISDYSLPLNSKIDVANYYDIARQINLDSSLESLNKNGFAVIANPFGKETTNFFAVYEKLTNQPVPILVTSDFLVYYYQNIVKKSFEDIKDSVFYESLWTTNKKMYDLAKDRYEAKISDQSKTDEISLESARLELSFFATSLALLSPTADQINNKSFSADEASQYYIQFPSYLKSDIDKEVSLIKNAKTVSKSPTLFYDVNYSDFSVPRDYQDDAHLKNFYLASRWLNSVFPLFYKSADCQDCLLDKDDWRINMIAALFISEDLSSDQDLQRNWAEVYKTISYFEGLRADLNYLYYYNSFVKIFGQDKKVQDILNGSLSETDENLQKIQADLATINFSEIEGGISKTDLKVKKSLGFKMLAEFFQPSISISQVLNVDNSNFNVSSWHNNVYWSTVEIARKLLEAPQAERPIFMKSQTWREKDLLSATAYLANSQINPDVFVSSPNINSNLNQIDVSAQSYVEPNLSLVLELLADTKEISSALTQFNANDKIETATGELKDLDDNLTTISDIIKKELNNEILSADDLNFLKDFTGKFIVKEASSKTNLSTLKLLILVHKSSDKNFFAVGPVFNYQENKK